MPSMAFRPVVKARFPAGERRDERLPLRAVLEVLALDVKASDSRVPGRCGYRQRAGWRWRAGRQSSGGSCGISEQMQVATGALESLMPDTGETITSFRSLAIALGFRAKVPVRAAVEDEDDAQPRRCCSGPLCVAWALRHAERGARPHDVALGDQCVVCGCARVQRQPGDHPRTAGLDALPALPEATVVVEQPRGAERPVRPLTLTFVGEVRGELCRGCPTLPYGGFERRAAARPASSESIIHLDAGETLVGVDHPATR